jgi:lysophospholipid acyltransferase (LPLAT)-like uncharacterized protein
VSFLKRLGRSEKVRAAAGSFLAGYLKFVWHTGRFQFSPPDVYDHADQNLPVIIAMWHGQHFLSPFVKKAHHKIAVLISRSNDGEMNAIAAEKLGISTIRGSGAPDRRFDRKGGVGAFKEMVDALKDGTSVALTADVPKIAKRAGLGCVMLAKYSGRPILPAAVATARRIDLKSWDKASINLPFSRGAVVVGVPVWVPADADTEMLEAKRLEVEEKLNQVTARALAISEGRETATFWTEAEIAGSEAEKRVVQEILSQRAGAIDA